MNAMAILTERDRAAVRKEFEKLTGPVKLVVFSQELVAGDLCRQNEQLVRDVATLSDKLTVEVRNTSGALLSTLSTYSNLNAAAFAAYAPATQVSLLPWAGQTIRLYFRVVTNTSLDTTFFVDDVSVR